MVDHIPIRPYKSLLPGRQTSKWSFWHVVFHENNSKKLTACSSVVQRFQNFSGSYSDQDLFISKGGSEKEIYVPEEGADTGLFASVLQVSTCTYSMKLYFNLHYLSLGLQKPLGFENKT